MTNLIGLSNIAVICMYSELITKHDHIQMALDICTALIMPTITNGIASNYVQCNFSNLDFDLGINNGLKVRISTRNC